MIPSSKFQRMFLVPEYLYNSILKKSDNMEKSEMRELNKPHEDKEFFADAFEKEPKHEYNKSDNDKDDDDDQEKSKNETDIDQEISANETVRDISNDDTVGNVSLPTSSKHSTPKNRDQLPSINIEKSKKIDKIVSPQVEGYTCPKCDRKFQRKSGMISHVKMCKNINKYKYVCKVCDKKYVTKLYLDKHVDAKHVNSGDLTATPTSTKKKYPKKQVNQYKRSYNSSFN